MTVLEEVRSEYQKQVDEHLEENRAAALKIRDILADSPVNYNGVFDKTVHIPKVYDKETIDRFQEIAGMTHRIFEKVIDAYQTDPEYRKLFPFSKELEELMCLPIPYDSKLPMARFDLFYYEDTGDFKFCEINTDGTAAMVRDLEYRKAIVHNPAHQAVLEQYDLQPFEVGAVRPPALRSLRQLGEDVPRTLQDLSEARGDAESRHHRHPRQRDHGRLRGVPAPVPSRRCEL